MMFLTFPWFEYLAFYLDSETYTQSCFNGNLVKSCARIKNKTRLPKVILTKK